MERKVALVAGASGIIGRGIVECLIKRGDWEVIALARANVISIAHDRVGQDIPIGRAEVTFNLETQNIEHTKSLVSALGKARLKYKLVN